MCDGRNAERSASPAPSQAKSCRIRYLAAMPAALDTDQAKTIGIVTIVALLLIGVVLGFVITAIVGRIVVVVVVVALGALVWTQRASIEDHVKKCDAKFLGIHLTPSDPSIKAQCQKLTNR